ncbi:MAG TPA: GNAT family N-acetyltransferase [bacterium]|nr:GNAT family N-acetyltransferase [bacterium]
MEITGKNLNEIIELSNLVFRPKEKSMKIETPLMWEKGKHFVIKENEEIVSFIGMVEEEINVFGYKMKIGNIGNVCTHPDYRNKGYATCLLNETIKKAKEDKLVYLMISGGRELYKRAGAVSMPFYFYQFSGNKGKTDFRVRRYKDDLYCECIKIYQKEPVRFLRENKGFSSLFSLYNGKFKKKVMHMGSKIWIISKNKEILAYWAEGETKDGISIGYNREYGGIRELLAKVWKSRGKKVNIYIPLWDEELKYYLGKEKEVKEMGTILLINPNLLIENLSGYFIERGVEIDYLKRENKILLKANKKEKEFKDNKDLARFLLHLNNEEVWKNIFPIPLPFYGFNYA